jgi:hypothetical protein
LALCTGALAPTIAGAAELTVTRLGSTNNPSNYGQPVIFIAAVLAQNSVDTATGAVTFTDGTNVLGNVPLDDNGRATFTTSSLAAGSHSIAATYMPKDPLSFSGSSATLTQNVTSDSTSTSTITTTITLTSTPNPSDSSGLPTGAVTFLDGSTALGTGPLDKSGRIAFATSKLAVGQHLIVANYNGDADFAGSQSNALTQTVHQ